LRVSAHLVRDLLLQLHKIIIPGVNELDIASFCENYILIRGAEPILKTSGMYSHSVMISTNNVAFHGIPKDSKLKTGDLVTVDVVLLKDGWYGDGAWTYEVGHCSNEMKELVQFSQTLVYKCVETLEKERDVSSLGTLISSECRKRGLRVIDEGAGHGIGRLIHEEPLVLFQPHTESIPLQSGMVFTIEPVITNNDAKIEYNVDSEAYLPQGSMTVQFEHMVAVNDWGIEILTDREPLFK
jgi:methionyl aminopeptidase